MNFGFERPLLAVLTILIPVAAFILSRLKNPFVETIPLGAPGGVPFKASKIGGFVNLLKALEFSGVLLLFLGAASPSIIRTETVWLNRGADIVFILDVSPSMAALDMDGKNRFSAAKNLIQEFAQRRPSDNFALVAVGTDAALLVPPTADRDVFYSRLEQLRLGEFGEDTALGMGLAVATYHLDKSNAARKTAILITDGENNAGSIHPETAASMLREMNISFWVIGLGSMGEVPIDYTDPYTNIRFSGIFDSRFDTESLVRLALTGGGTYIYAPSADAFASAFSRINEEEITIRISRVIHQKRSVSLYFLLPAIVLLVGARTIRRNILGAAV